MTDETTIQDWPEVLRVKDAACYLKVSEATVRNYLKRPVDPLPHQRLGYRTIRIERDDLSEWYRRQPIAQN